MRYVFALAALLLAACAPMPPPASVVPLGDPLPLSMDEAGAFWAEHSFTCDSPGAEPAGAQSVRCTVDMSQVGEGTYHVQFTGDAAGVREILASTDLSDVDDPERQLDLARGFLAGTVPDILGSGEQADAVREWMGQRLASDATGVVAGLRLEIDVSSIGPSVRITSE